VYAELHASQALTLRAFSEAGATPWLEGDPDPRAAKDAGAASGIDTLPPPASGNGAGAAANAAPSMATAPAPGGPALDPTGARDPAASGGCSASPAEPTHGAVEHALGIVFLILLVLRFRSARRLRESSDADASSMRDANGRIPYVDLGMRESFASLSDDR
jgi:hypothetical protein